MDTDGQGIPRKTEKFAIHTIGGDPSGVLALNSQELLRQFQKGDSQAAAAIFDRYLLRLLALARSRIGPKLRRRIDADDVVQSTYRSFFVHAANDEYVLARAGDLWRLLAGITLNKLYGQLERHTASRRNIYLEDQDAFAAHDTLAPEPTPDEVAGIVEQLHFVIDQLNTTERTVLTARLQGMTIEEIGVLIKKSPRTVRRILTGTRRQIEHKLTTNEPSASVRNVARAHGTSSCFASLSFSDYVLERLWGAGGMGKVYRATERSTGMLVAIKALRKSRQEDWCAVEKFLQEAQILASLKHPSIVGIHGLGRFPGGGFFIVMDFVDGTDLQSRIAKGPLEIVLAVGIVHAVAGAIAYAHQQGVVHGDLKPANVLLDKTDRVIVTDFGLAQFIGNEAQQREPRWLIGGTAGYMAPEVRVNGTVPGPAADVYGMGALLWTLVTGVVPDGPDSVHGHRMASTSLSNVCAKCLATNPKSRYLSANDLLSAIGQMSMRESNYRT